MKNAENLRYYSQPCDSGDSLFSKIEVFSESETATITRAIMAKPNLTNIGILLGLETGLRIGEIYALRWSYIDFEDSLFYVRRTLQYRFQSFLKQQAAGHFKTCCLLNALRISGD